MTTTGGPEQSFADPASSNESADDPVVLQERDRLEGDDIVVEPHGIAAHPRRFTRELIVGVVVAVLAAAGVAIALATRHDSGANTRVTSSAPARTPGGHPTAGKAVVDHKAKPKPKTKTTTPATAPPVNIAQPTTPAVVPPAPPVSGQSPGSVGSGATVPTAPSVTMPPSEPPSVLQWTATPSTLSIKSGAHALLTVTVVNPTNGTVTLGHPLSCPPTLQPLHGAPLGATVCAEMAQIVSPHSRLVQHYTIYATDTGAADGKPLAAGSYLANVENLHNVKVTVTAN